MGAEFCQSCAATLDRDVAELEPLWAEAGEREFHRDEARRTVSLLFRVSHARILRELGERVARFYPTLKVYRGRLRAQRFLWWTQHATGGVSIRPCLVWFSGEPRPGKDGKLRLRGGSTHFVIDHDGTPYCLVGLDDGAWHCGQRNKDSLAVELVNACALRYVGPNSFRWWTGRPYSLPYAPVDLRPEPFRGAIFMQPYDERQFVAVVKLMRLCFDALGRERFDLLRVTRHTDWNPCKLDPGPLFPHEAIARAAFDFDVPVSELDWVQAFGEEEHPSWDVDSTVRPDELAELFAEASAADEEHGDSYEHTLDGAERTMWVQRKLAELGFYEARVDGIFGPLTHAATRAFQSEWNRRRPDDAVEVDGIPGPITQARLKIARGRWA